MPINQKVKNRLFGSGAIASVVLAGSILVAPWEGVKTEAYADVIGVWTVCYGETRGVKRGDAYTDEQCTDQLALSLPQYKAAMLKYVKVPLQPYEEAAYISFSYNVGIGNFAKSTLLTKLNKGQHQAACAELKKWVYASGKYFQGLANRREDEYQMCIGKHKDIAAVWSLPKTSEGLR
jgi:GH24 family phage-related lysozyme (muramidase)